MTICKQGYSILILASAYLSYGAIEPPAETILNLADHTKARGQRLVWPTDTLASRTEVKSTKKLSQYLAISYLRTK